MMIPKPLEREGGGEGGKIVQMSHLVMSIPLIFMLCTFSSCMFLLEPSSTTQINFTDEIERCMWFRNGTTNISTATAGDEGTCRCRTFQALVDLNWRQIPSPLKVWSFYSKLFN